MGVLNSPVAYFPTCISELRRTSFCIASAGIAGSQVELVTLKLPFPQVELVGGRMASEVAGLEDFVS